MKKEKDSTLKIEEILPEQLRESMSQLHIEKLQEAVDAAVEKKVQAQLGVAVKSAEANFDAMVNERLERLVERIDEANKVALERVCKSIGKKVSVLKEKYEKRIANLKQHARVALDESKKETRKAKAAVIREHRVTTAAARRNFKNFEETAKDRVVGITKKFMGELNETRESAVRAMRAMKENYEKNTLVEARAFKKNLVESLSRYLDGEIDKRVPYDTVKEAVKNRAAMQLVESLKKMLSVDAASKLDAIKEPINEARQLIAETNEQKNRLVKENNELRDLIDKKNRLIESVTEKSNTQIAKAKQMIAEAKRVAFLNERLSTLPSLDQRNFVKRIMADQPLEFIKENWDYAVKQYRAKEAKENAVLAEKAKAERKSNMLAQVSRKRLVEASRSVRQNREQFNESVSTYQSPTDEVIDDIIAHAGDM